MGTEVTYTAQQGIRLLLYVDRIERFRITHSPSSTCRIQTTLHGCCESIRQIFLYIYTIVLILLLRPLSLSSKRYVYMYCRKNTPMLQWCMRIMCEQERPKFDDQVSCFDQWASDAQNPRQSQWQTQFCSLHIIHVALNSRFQRARNRKPSTRHPDGARRKSASKKKI